MTDYLRQLQNDEKRQRSSLVGTLDAEDLVAPLEVANLAMVAIPEQAITGKTYAIVTEAFAAGSTLDWGIGNSPNDLFVGLDLTVVGSVASDKPIGGIYTTRTVTYITVKL